MIQCYDLMQSRFKSLAFVTVNSTTTAYSFNLPPNWISLFLYPQSSHSNDMIIIYLNMGILVNNIVVYPFFSQFTHIDVTIVAFYFRKIFYYWIFIFIIWFYVHFRHLYLHRSLLVEFETVLCSFLLKLYFYRVV